MPVLISHVTVLSINDDLTCIAGDNGERDAALCEQEHCHGEWAVPRPPDRREGRRPSRHSRDQSRPAQHHAALVSQN
jgi:hypothetical protein